LNEKISPSAVTAHHPPPPKLLICFEENNSTRDLRALNLVCNYRNLRLFDAKRRIISYQRSGLFVRVWRAYGECIYVAQVHVCGTRVCVALACSSVCVQNMTRVQKCQEKKGTLCVYYASAIVCCFYVFVCKQCIRI